MVDRTYARWRRALLEKLRHRRAAICAWTGLMALVVGLRLQGITTTSVWHDEATSIHVAGMSLSKLVIDMSVADNQAPLYYVILKIWAAPSMAPVWLRLLSVGLSMLTVVFAVKWLRLWSVRAGWIAGLLVAANPLLVHYGQEIRAYALMFWLVVAGLYCGERLGRNYTRGVRAGLLASTALLPYVHFVGFFAAAMLWFHAWLRGTHLRRVAILAGAWLLLVSPMLMLAFTHTREKTEVGYWIPRLDGPRAAELVLTAAGLGSGQFGQHGSIQLWESSYSGAGHSWAGLVLSAVLVLGLAVALLITVVVPDGSRRRAVGMLAATFGLYVAAMAVFSWLVVPIALERTVFAAFIPLIGVLALASHCPGQRLLAAIGTAACLHVATVWAVTSVLSAAPQVERRPNEQALFSQLAAKLTDADVIVIFPPEMQASAGYFLRDRVSSDQIHSSEAVRLAGEAGSVRLLPQPRNPDAAWLDRVRLAASQFRVADPLGHGVWLVDMGIRSSGDQQRRRLVEWLDRGYRKTDSIVVGDRWMFAADRYVWKSASAMPATQSTGWD